MDEYFQILELLKRITKLKAKGLTAERVAYSFMKRRVQPLMQRELLGYEYTGADDTSRMSLEEISDDVVMLRLGRIFRNMKQEVTTTTVREYYAEYPPKEVSNHGRSSRVLITGCMLLFDQCLVL